MAKKLSKLDAMGVCESALSDEGLEDTKEAIADATQCLETFEENREQAINSFQEAVSYHEERDWDSRNGSLEEAASAVEEMSNALDLLEALSETVKLPDGREEQLRKTIAEVQDHLGNLV